jgi:hypothetical protein
MLSLGHRSAVTVNASWGGLLGELDAAEEAVQAGQDRPYSSRKAFLSWTGRRSS